MADVTLSAKITGDSSSLEKALNRVVKALEQTDDETEKTSSTLGNKFSNAAGTMAKASLAALGAAATAASAAILKIGKDSLAAYADYEQLTGGIETLFGDAYDTVMDNANNAFMTAGLSANEYMEQVTSFSASLLQATGKDTETAAKIADMAMQDMSDNANKMGTSMESIQNAYQGFAKQNYTMLDNLKLGYGGTKEEMERLLKDAQEITGVKYDIKNLDDVYTAIHVVQGELGITGTTAKEAATTIQGSISMMKSSWQNLLVGIADDSQNFDVLMDNFINSVVTVGDNIIPRMETIVGGIGKLISSLAETAFPKLIAEIPSLFQEMLPLVISSANILLTSLISIFPDLINTVISFLPKIINGILAFLPTLIEAGIDIIIALITGITTALPDVLDAIVSVINELVSVITEPKMLTNFVMAAVDLILALANGLIDAIPKLLPAIPIIIINVVTALINLLPELIPVAIQLMTVLAKELVTYIPILINSLPMIFSAIFTAFKNTDWGQIGKDIINGLISGLKSMISNLGETVRSIASSVADSFKNALGIHSPSKVFMEYGVYTDEGYAIGVDKGADEIYKSFADLNLTAHVNELPSARNITTAGTTSTANVGSALNIDNIGDYIISAVNSNAKILADGISKMKMVADDREIGRFVSKLGFAKA